jgi:hypothetical protein
VNDFLNGMLEEVQRLDPSININPGSAVRHLLETAARAGHTEHLRIQEQIERLYVEQPPIDQSWIERQGLGLITRSPQPITREMLRETFESLERQNLRPALQPMFNMETIQDLMGMGIPIDPQSLARQVGIQPPTFNVDRAERVRRARNFAVQSIQAAEDEEIFRQLDAAALEPMSPQNYYNRVAEQQTIPEWRQELLGQFMEPREIASGPGWRMEELPGDAVFNERAMRALGAQRVEMPLFEMHSSPTISLEEVRHRRFDIIDRTPPPPPPKEMTLEQMEKVAIIVRRSAWERLLLVEELDF